MKTSKSFWQIIFAVMGAVFISVALSACGGAGCSTAGCDSGGSSGTSTVSSISLTASAGTLLSAGTSGTEVTITALVRDASNNVVSSAPVSWVSSSGIVAAASSTSGSDGKVTATLGTGGDPTNRTITVSASANGHTATIAVDVVGTTLAVTAGSSVNAGSSEIVQISLKNSSGAGVSGQRVDYRTSSSTDTLNGASSGYGTTDSNGQLSLTFAAGVSSTGTDNVTITSGGVTQSIAIAINSANFYISPVTSTSDFTVPTSANINACQIVRVWGGVGTSATVNSSRGAIYSDSGCTTTTNSVTLSSGSAFVYAKSSNPGVATLTATTASQTASGSLKFIAPLTGSDVISTQASPAVVGVNLGSSSANRSTITAVVRDAVGGNLVEGATVNFSIVTDPSGGSLSSASAVTGSNGTASVSFIPGATSTSLNGVAVRATIVGGSNGHSDVTLTVASTALRISAGTGNTVGTSGSTLYTKQYAVLITDSSGNPVNGATVTASVVPTYYGKGDQVWNGSTMWIINNRTWCANEDVDHNGIYSVAKDTNGNGTLEPGNGAVNVTSSTTTGTDGTAVITLTYTKDRARWINVDLIITGSVSGTETTYKASFVLQGLATDYTTETVSPPGEVSPYGTTLNCSTPG